MNTPDPATGLLRDLRALSDDVEHLATNIEALDARRRGRTQRHARRDRAAAVMSIDATTAHLSPEFQRNMNPAIANTPAFLNAFHRAWHRLRGQ